MIKSIKHKIALPTYESRSFRKRVPARYRMLTHENRALPDFMIIGTQKGGTTSLYKYLTKHPNIKSNYVVKELSFFDEYYSRGKIWYRSNFPKRKKGKLYFEGTTHYLYNPLVPKRVKQMLPNVKVIALLRDPIDRAYSGYKHQLRAGRETLNFENAIQAESERLNGEKEKLLSDPSYISYNYNHFSYVERGKYADQINNWLEHFSKEQMLVLSSEDFFKNTDNSLKQIYDFLGVEYIKTPIEKKHNTGNYKDTMSKEMREKLKLIFKPYNVKLQKLLGRDFF
jgi:hypothetical protein